MSKFLVAVMPFPGHYFPLIAVAQALRDHGHEVAFYTSAKISPVLAAEGLTCFPFQQIDEITFWATVDGRDTFASADHAIKTRRHMNAWAVGSLPLQVADLLPILDKWEPDVIIADISMWGPAMVLHDLRHIPVAAFSIFAGCMLPGPHLPPFGLGMKPPHTWQARLRVRAIRAGLALSARPRRRAVDRLRRLYDLPPLPTSPVVYWGKMPLYLMPSVPEFDYRRHDLPPSVHYIGPCIWNKPRSRPTPAWLQQLPHDKPWVLISEGTSNPHQPLLLPAAAAGLADLPMHVIIATGDRDPETLGFGRLAPNIHVVDWVPFRDLLPETAVLATTGGSGQVMTALQCGVPMVVVPTEWDQPENANRVVAAGAGVQVAPHQCTPEAVREAVQEVLQNPAYTRAARQMQTILAGYDGPRRAVELLETLVPTSQRLAVRELTMA